mmetsp:Transcript_1855/g.4078  ORF Transcript_1855/g.4078 Transcript_1855/m.4078 type:complete len:281 (+) Transcript_1855:139-981(+)|eukprot:scaffold4855_cov195-Amphora_coffeaeformis.AAC.16
MSSTKRKSISDDLTASAKKKKGSRGLGAVKELVEDEFGGDGLAFLQHLEENAELSANKYMTIFDDEKYKKGWQHLNQIKRQLKGEDIAVLGLEWKELVSDYHKKAKKGKRAVDKSKAVTPERANKKAKTGGTTSTRKKAPESTRKTSARKKAAAKKETPPADPSTSAVEQETIEEPPSVKVEPSKGSENLTGNKEAEELQGKGGEGTTQESSSAEIKAVPKSGFFSQHPWIVVIAGYVALLTVGYGIVYFSVRPGPSDTTPPPSGGMGEGGYQPPNELEL